MRCSCQRCGAYMVQDEKGVQSRCICPECFFVCSACIGTSGQVVDVGHNLTNLYGVRPVIWVDTEGVKELPLKFSKEKP